MSTPPLVSVCIGAYNRERYIRETLDSVFAQTYPALEVIVVDDASTDRTVEIIQSYGNRVKLIRRAANSGLPAVPRNQAIAEATGDLVAFLDADDLWYPSKLEKQVEWMRLHPAVSMVHCRCDVINEAGVLQGARHGAFLLSEKTSLEALLRHCFISISAVLVRRSVLSEVGGFNEDSFYRAREDYELFLRIVRQRPIGWVPGDALAAYRVSEDSISHRGDQWRRAPEDVPMHRRVLHRPELWEGVVSRAVVFTAFADNALTNAQHWRDQGYPWRALFFAASVLRESPLHRGAWLHVSKSLVRSMLRRKPSVEIA